MGQQVLSWSPENAHRPWGSHEERDSHWFQRIPHQPFPTYLRDSTRGKLMKNCMFPNLPFTTISFRKKTEVDKVKPRKAWP